MATPTSRLNERLIHADVTSLNPPEWDGEDPVVLVGTQAQIQFASSMRTKKLREWASDLPEHIFKALHGIPDSTWWLANKGCDSSNIGWPASWTTNGVRTHEKSGQSTLPLTSNRDKLMQTAGLKIPDPSSEQFEKFARKVCQSPELAYLTIMAFAAKMSGSQAVKDKLQETRSTIQGHLDAIDSIAK